MWTIAPINKVDFGRNCFISDFLIISDLKLKFEKKIYKSDLFAFFTNSDEASVIHWDLMLLSGI